MVIGHIALALAAKRAAPRTSLGTLVAAAMLPDLVWPVLMLVRAEGVAAPPGPTTFAPLEFAYNPWSHSLLTVLLLGVIAGLVYGYRSHNRAGMLLIPLLASSHWLLDWITNTPVLPLVPGGPLHGLGVWQSLPHAILIESILLIWGGLVYYRGTEARDRTGHFSFWLFLLFVAALYLAAAFVPFPPGLPLVAATAVAAVVLLCGGAVWLDRHRRPV
jgi:hypothetical protein